MTKGGVGGLSAVTSCRTLCDSQNVICWPVAGVCCLWWSLLGWLLCTAVDCRMTVVLAVELMH